MVYFLNMRKIIKKNVDEEIKGYSFIDDKTIENPKNEEIKISSFIDDKTIENINDKLDNEKNTHILNKNMFPDLLSLKKHYKIFLNEYEEFTNEIDSSNLHQNSVMYFASNIDTNKKWNSVILKLFGKNTLNYKYFPKTKKILDQNKKIISVFISIMKPGAVITPHTGVYRGVLRYHLGLKVPKKRKNCYIIINKDKYSWKEGEEIIFDDMFEHEVRNETDEERIVLFLDIEKDFKNNLLYETNRDFLKNIVHSKPLEFYIKKINNNLVRSIIEKLVNNNNHVLVEPNKTKEEKLYILKDHMQKIIRSDKITMATNEDILILLKVIENVIANKIKGDFVEVGVWRGGTSLIAKLFFEMFEKQKEFHLIDTFKYFPDSENEDKKIMREIKNLYDGYYHSIEKIRDNFKKYKLEKGVNFISLDISGKYFNHKINKICILRIDCDTYDSVYNSLVKMFYLVEKGGFIIIDDYLNEAVNCKLAVDNFIKDENLNLEKNTISSSLIINI